MEFEFVSPEDKPALLGITNPELLGAAHLVLSELGYKVHAPTTHEEFLSRFAQVQYQVVIIEEKYSCTSPDENTALINLRTLPMMLRRHATVLLMGDSFHTMHPMQAFQQSVHAVVNTTDMLNLKPIVQKTIAENDLFLAVYRDAQLRIAKGGG